MQSLGRSVTSLQALRLCFAPLHSLNTCRMLATQSSDHMVDDMLKFVRTGCQVWAQSRSPHNRLQAAYSVVSMYAIFHEYKLLAQPSSLHTGQHTASNRYLEDWLGSPNRQWQHTTPACYGRSPNGHMQLGMCSLLPDKHIAAFSS